MSKRAKAMISAADGPPSTVPKDRIMRRNDAPVRSDRDYVLYWMTTSRRLSMNFALDEAMAWARHLRKPLLVLEALRVDYPFASDRLHAFLMEGMAANARAARRLPLTYLPYIEPDRGAGRGLLAALAMKAAIVVGDDHPCSFFPRMTASAARQLDVAFEVVDSNGLLPMRSFATAFPTAYAFRRACQRVFLSALAMPQGAEALRKADIPRARVEVPSDLDRRYGLTKVDDESLAPDARRLDALPIDHSVKSVELSKSPKSADSLKSAKSAKAAKSPNAATDGSRQGGSATGARLLEDFVSKKLPRYAEDRNHPDLDATSGLSPYLHAGHVGAHEIFSAITAGEWTPASISEKNDGRREGWWGLDASREAFLDQLITWRELGFNMCCVREDYRDYDSLPDWAKTTLAMHEPDVRPHLYDIDLLEAGRTHDRVWNAAQRQLVEEGRLHNYMRMLWGKKILEWSPSPRMALETMIHLNDKYALDGRDPNSYSGIFWTLGRYDRPFGPERSIFGKVRFMSSDNTRKKLRVAQYLDRYAGTSAGAE